MKEKDRNIGLDLLRIISMLMIVSLHYLGKGGVLWNTTEGSLSWGIVWLVEAFCYTSVNCYVFISAYFLSASDKKIKLSKVVELLVTMLFYSIGLTVILGVTGKANFNIKDILCSVFPFLTKSYWFMNVYILLYILHPYLNKLIGQMEQKEYRRLLIIMLVFFSLAQSILPFIDWTLDETRGYGILWFVTLYFVSGYIRKYQINISSGQSIGLFVAGGGDLFHFQDSFVVHNELCRKR
jgi:surface polysaccharide O-acyltransferase-like enzyme